MSNSACVASITGTSRRNSQPEANNPTATSAQILATMKVSTLDIEAAGWDRDSGAGIVMVPSPLVFASTYTIGGSVSGLGAGKSVGLLNNGADPITRNANGSFTGGAVRIAIHTLLPRVPQS